MRKQKKYHFIYKTTNILSGKYYLGMHSTNNLEDGYLGSGRRLRYSINKYGKENHKREILEFCNSREELVLKEEYIVNLNEIAKVDCMNLRIGGTGGFSSEEHRIQFHKAGQRVLKWKRENDETYIKNHSKCSSINMKKKRASGKIKPIIEYYNWTGNHHSTETKQKIGLTNSIKQKGIKNSQYGTCWITDEKINKKIYRGDEIPNGFRLGRK